MYLSKNPVTQEASRSFSYSELKGFHPGLTFFRRIQRAIMTGSIALAIAVPIVLPTNAAAVQAIPVADTYVHKTFPKPLGLKGALRLTPKSSPFIQFDVDSVLPDNTTPEQVEKATLKLFFRKVPKGGKMHISTVLGDWSEKTLKASNAPALSAPIPNSTVQIDKDDASQFVIVDVTDIVRGWITNPDTNHGFALVATDDCSR
jgi:hypothetical protein